MWHILLQLISLGLFISLMRATDIKVVELKRGIILTGHWNELVSIFSRPAFIFLPTTQIFYPRGITDNRLYLIQSLPFPTTAYFFHMEQKHTIIRGRFRGGICLTACHTSVSLSPYLYIYCWCKLFCVRQTWYSYFFLCS